MKNTIFTAVKEYSILHEMSSGCHVSFFRFFEIILTVATYDLVQDEEIVFCIIWKIQSPRLVSGNLVSNVSLVVRNPVFGVSDQVRHKPGCKATEDG